MKKHRMFLSVLLGTLSAASLAHAMSVTSVAHVATVAHVTTPHVSVPTVHISEPVVSHPVIIHEPVAPVAPLPPSRPVLVERADPAKYPPKVTPVYVPQNAHFTIPRGVMQPFCKDPQAFRDRYPISFSDEEFRGMVNACFRAKQEGKEAGDYTQ